ncbi:MAG TPA: M1 family aminopeptidase, partial [Roseiflexaceae bacterium]|nr:M1 family aminopeptidase [Roseiflexaceae bacterium]
DGAEQWSIDLSAWAGKDVEVSISYASDDTVQLKGAFVDDIVVSTGEGSTSFEDDGDVMDGWAVPGAPEGSATNPNDWIVGTVADVPPPTGTIVQASFARQPEIIDFLSGLYGPYPFSAAGGIVDSVDGLGFALETQTRPIYSKDFFTDQISGDDVVVHELAHQWIGDNLALARWRHIWLNEGFATYSQWLWSEREGLGSAQEIFDFYYGIIPPDDPFWTVKIGDPGPDLVFDIAVYYRGAMALHQLRLAVGDETFFQILREWTRTRAGENVTIPQFIRLAERISGKDLDALFDAWLFTTAKPELSAAAQARAANAAATRYTAPAFAQRQLKQVMHPQRASMKR